MTRLSKKSIIVIAGLIGVVVFGSIAYNSVTTPAHAALIEGLPTEGDTLKLPSGDTVTNPFNSTPITAEDSAATAATQATDAAQTTDTAINTVNEAAAKARGYYDCEEVYTKFEGIPRTGPIASLGGCFESGILQAILDGLKSLLTKYLPASFKL
jgi:hypothetical protein